MNTSPSLQNKTSALVVMANRLNVEPSKLHSTLKETVFKNASEAELLALVVVANEYGLNPLTKEIYAFPSKGGGIVPVVSIDGWIHLCNLHPQFNGVEFEYSEDQNGKPISCTAIIHRKDRSKPTRVTEYYFECRRESEPWKTMPHRMLRHKAFMQCARIAFGFSGITDEDEARDITTNSQPKYTITRPKFDELPEKKTELFTTTLERIEEDNIPMEAIVEASVEER